MPRFRSHRENSARGDKGADPFDSPLSFDSVSSAPENVSTRTKSQTAALPVERRIIPGRFDKERESRIQRSRPCVSVKLYGVVVGSCFTLRKLSTKNVTHGGYKHKLFVPNIFNSVIKYFWLRRLHPPQLWRHDWGPWRQAPSSQAGQLCRSSLILLQVRLSRSPLPFPVTYVVLLAVSVDGSQLKNRRGSMGAE